ncbi:uncharacterized protein SEPMUDRAFT_150826 [Sphaerulina musiva SO2202]|uniref:4'-phosphopantetheinyl transferase domain-containing protein n=1 Tax=Sphaerulina musiva (strain SO2202) TaxID=692275 RepID=N1QI74_SPHMS|nr:uncharacterized protein SEPMUDRAFT_150826 [Sphaerulina musiva SO2202]EMF10868.1 hypothetical protein SEPMUDRAFT_150826 [Sphaerulina musiva SO2202]
MPPRPFPFALRIGTDIVSQARLRDLITRPKAGHGTGTQLDAFLRRVFTEREQFVFWKRFAGFHVSNTQRLPLVVSHLAGRWAAKEAAIKAVKPRKVTHRDVEILQDRDTKELYALIQDHPNVLGAPYFRIKHLDLQNNSPAESEEKEPSVPSQGSMPNLESQEQQENPDDSAAQVAKISISHDADYATAVCLAAEDPIPGDVGGEAAARQFSAP